MHWQQRWLAILNKTQVVTTTHAVDQLLDTLAHPVNCHVLAFVNAHAMNSSAEAVNFYEALISADTVLRDGSGMALLYRLLGREPGLNLNGTDLIPKIISRFNGRPISLYGTTEPFLSTAAQVMSRTLCSGSKIAVSDGFSNPATYVELAAAQQPALIVLGMGMPKQEIVARLLRNNSHSPCLIVCGGAIVDFLGRRTRRAPKLLRILGLEWAFRLMLEPRRLFSRYVLGNPIFVWRSLRLSWPL
jgi:N-acetylglucosaminyldiphosphoundecaprenol N-acetyl-beta-D-mannosaminyltransferase